jgi:flagellar basal body-associated protein FliL
MEEINMADEVKEQEKPQKSGMPFLMKALIIATLAILVVVISVGTSFFVASKMSAKNAAQGELVSQDEETMSIEKVEFGKTEFFGEYTVNLKETEPRYLVVSVYVEFVPEIKEKQLEKVKVEVTDTYKVIIQDRMISVLMSKSIKNLTDDKNFELLRNELKAEVNAVLGSEYINNIRFSNVLIQ